MRIISVVVAGEVRCQMLFGNPNILCQDSPPPPPPHLAPLSAYLCMLITVKHRIVLLRIHVGIWIIDYCPLGDSLLRPVQISTSIYMQLLLDLPDDNFQHYLNHLF